MLFDLETSSLILLILSLVAACGFEFVNGFHDTANAVATVIYTNSLKPWQAVMWSGFCNFVGVLLGGVGVAMGVINLLPAEALAAQDIGQNIAMILSLLLSAIIWNLGTWYFGLPSSSSHTLIGSILGVGLTFSWLSGDLGAGVNWTKAREIMIFLVISPVFGFTMAILLLRLFFWLIKSEKFFSPPPQGTPPPIPMRLLSILTCTLISTFHGSNDGQKGVGLVMLILISVVPLHFALNEEMPLTAIPNHVKAIQTTLQKVQSTDEQAKGSIAKIVSKSGKILAIFETQAKQLSADQTLKVRSNIASIHKEIPKLLKNEALVLDKEQQKVLSEKQGILKIYTDYSPFWVTLMISLSLGIGTMVGWKRIVVTIGEKIGKSGLSYAQGSAAELIAASTIGMASQFGVPVSTTHILSSSVAGTMFALKGKENLNPKTLKNIAMAWLLTLPVSIVLAGALFMILRNLF
jgi:PiT family inorganic phosphate transporter